MPMYNYLCSSCGLRFEKRVGMSERANTTCECGQTAQQAVPDDVSFGFNQPTSGIAPQNTGIASLDTSYDRVIAQDAALRWEAQTKRDAVKRDVLRQNPEATKQDLAQTPDGGYRVLKPEERQISEKARVIDAVAQLGARAIGPNRARFEPTPTKP